MAGTEVYILGQKYTIKGDDASDKHIEELAKLINGRIGEVCKKYPSIAPMQALIITLFNMADDLWKVQSEQDDLTKGIREKADLLVKLFE